MARIVFDVQIDAPSKDVAAALDSAAGIAGWWSEDVRFDGGEGSVMTIGFPGRAPVPFEIRVDEVTEQQIRWASVGAFPPHWAGTGITWTMTPDGEGGTNVRFVHDDWASDEGFFGSSALTWGALMFSLKAYTETGTGMPLYRKPRP